MTPKDVKGIAYDVIIGALQGWGLEATNDFAWWCDGILALAHELIEKMEAEGTEE